ncbi:MAG TPA: hypothetical protein VMV01_06630, partial [Planctomycetota bacterium]|nr:hypothetical protein [Planctomycetota bacterium]
ERDKRLGDQVLEALEEHHVAKTTLAELDKMKVDDERYEAKMTVLRESVEHHVAEEEGSMFPMVLDSSLDIDRLGEQMAARREELLAQVRDEQSDDYEED